MCRSKGRSLHCNVQSHKNDYNALNLKLTQPMEKPRLLKQLITTRLYSGLTNLQIMECTIKLPSNSLIYKHIRFVFLHLQQSNSKIYHETRHLTRLRFWRSLIPGLNNNSVFWLSFSVQCVIHCGCDEPSVRINGK